MIMIQFNLLRISFTVKSKYSKLAESHGRNNLTRKDRLYFLVNLVDKVRLNE
jgi:hypothetical protein